MGPLMTGGGATISRSTRLCVWTTVGPGSSPAELA